jgi:hypothetical protein
MDNTVPSPAPTEAPRPTRPDLDSWRGDIRERPPAWRRRPKSERVRAFVDAARPLIGRIGEGQTWE